MLKSAFILSLGFSILAGCSDRGDPELAIRGADWLKTYYKENPVAEGKWMVRNIRTKGGTILANVVIPDEKFVSTLKAMSPEQKFNYLSTVVCPNQHEEFWRIVNPDQNYVVEVGGLSSGVFIDINCRLWVK